MCLILISICITLKYFIKLLLTITLGKSDHNSENCAGKEFVNGSKAIPTLNGSGKKFDTHT